MSTVATDIEMITIKLRKAQVQSLRALAERRGVSLDELIQDGIDHVQATIESENELMLGLIGIGEDQPDTPTDMAENHDRYLAEMARERNR